MMKDKDHLFVVDKQYFRNLKSLPDNNPTYIRVDIGNRIVKSFRLDLIPLKKADMPEYYKLYSDATVVEKYCRGKPRPPQEIDELLSPYFYDEEPSYFSIFKKDSSDFMGTIVLTNKNQEPGTFVLGYLLHTDYWGNNYAKEALYGLLFCLFPIIRKEALTISATTRADNPSSKSILESFNFRYIQETEKFGKKRLAYELDTKVVEKVHNNIEIPELYPFKKNLGIISFTSSEILENSHVYKYCLKEIILPIFPDYTSSQIDHLFSYIPQDNSYWISAHFIFTSIGFFALSHNNPKYSLFTKFSLPLISTAGYSSKLLITDLHQDLAHDRITSITNNQPDNFLDNCLYEVAFSTASTFAFSLPAALSFTPFGLSYSAFSTISSFASSAISCAASNKMIISPNDNSFSAKALPYVIDSAVAFSTIRSLSFHPVYSLPEIAMNVKKATLVLSSIVASDHVTKSIITLTSDEIFTTIDYFFGFDNATKLHTPEL